MATGQMGLFDGVKLAEPEPTTTVRLGRKAVQIPLRKIDGQPVKATLRITGEFTPGTTSRVSGAGLEAATVSTPSSLRERKRHPLDD